VDADPISSEVEAAIVLLEIKTTGYLDVLKVRVAVDEESDHVLVPLEQSSHPHGPLGTAVFFLEGDMAHNDSDLTVLLHL